MTNPTKQRARQTSRKLPRLSRIYSVKRLICDKIAACILIEPALENSFPQTIDRERIDPALRSMLVLASISHSAERLALRVNRQMGPKYLFDLIALVDPLDHRQNIALIGQFDWYVLQLVRILQTEAEFDAAALAILDAKDAESRIVAEFGGRV